MTKILQRAINYSGHQLLQKVRLCHPGLEPLTGLKGGVIGVCRGSITSSVGFPQGVCAQLQRIPVARQPCSLYWKPFQTIALGRFIGRLTNIMR
jgi:hypothetical protein